MLPLLEVIRYGRLIPFDLVVIAYGRTCSLLKRNFVLNRFSDIFKRIVYELLMTPMFKKFVLPSGRDPFLVTKLSCKWC